MAATGAAHGRGAVDAYTCWPAYAAGEEGYHRGCIRAGHVADLVVLSEDIFSISPQRILDTDIDLTVLDGVVWRRALAHIATAG